MRNGLGYGERGSYQLDGANGPIELVNKNGNTYSDASTASWNALAATENSDGSGFQVLLQGTGNKTGSFYVWSTDANGVIQKGSGWKSTAQALDLGWEQLFSTDLNQDSSANSSGASSRQGLSLAFSGSKASYQLDGANGPIELVNKNGNTYSDASTASWNALAATENSDGSGFQVLLQGTGNKAGSFYVWSTDANGVIQKGSGWKSTAQALDLGWEQLFSTDLNQDSSANSSGASSRQGLSLAFSGTKASYQLDGANGPIELVNKNGNTYSDASTASWNALAATENSDGSGFQVLLQGTGNKAGSFYVWSTDANGVIQKGSGWKSTAQALDLGWEQLFSTDLNQDSSANSSGASSRQGLSLAFSGSKASYQLDGANGPIELVNKNGNTYSDASTASWNALAATENSDGSGFQVLLQGTGNKAGSFYVWSTDANGVIQKGSGWKSTAQALDLGWEQLFSTDLNQDSSANSSGASSRQGLSLAFSGTKASYQLDGANGPIELVNKNGNTYSDASTASWNALAATENSDGSGFQVLLQGTGNKAGSFYVWSTDANGVIQKGSGWKSTAQALDLGWEQLFSTDLNQDSSANSSGASSRQGLSLAFSGSKASYQLDGANGPIELVNKNGNTYSDASTASWNALAATENSDGSGFQVLLQGTGNKAGSFYVWSTDANGVIQKGSGWKSTAQALDLGWEQLFSTDLNQDSSANSSGASSRQGLSLALSEKKSQLSTRWRQWPH